MIRLLARHPTAGNLLLAIFIVFGGFMATTVRRESMPDITPRRVEVQVVYPGASAEDVERSRTDWTAVLQAAEGSDV